MLRPAAAEARPLEEEEAVVLEEVVDDLAVRASRFLMPTCSTISRLEILSNALVRDLAVVEAEEARASP